MIREFITGFKKRKDERRLKAKDKLKEEIKEKRKELVANRRSVRIPYINFVLSN